MIRFVRTVLCGTLLAASLPAMAIFTNGGFESGDFTGWTQGTGYNNGLTLPQPFTGASINLSAGGIFTGAVVNSSYTELSGAPITPMPFAGTYSARVGDTTPNNNTNFISQQDVITAADRDSGDNQLHVHFSYAVVLEDPGHDPEEQPFFYLRVRNITKGTDLYEDFSFAGQTGTQFQPIPSPGNPRALYLNWKPADVVVPDADLGDTIEVYLLAAGCSWGGHYGYAYLDGFGSRVIPPGGDTAVTPVPTLSEMSFMALGLLLAGAGAVSLRRRRS